MQLLSDASNLENNGKKIYHLELGEPPQIIPLVLKNEVEKLLSCNLPGYTPSNGIEELRKKKPRHSNQPVILLNNGFPNVDGELLGIGLPLTLCSLSPLERSS